ncbi:MAG: hypothetical protein WCV81_01305 [Microgenomates group bacterium]|jgi:hypothetical protein
MTKNQLTLLCVALVVISFAIGNLSQPIIKIKSTSKIKPSPTVPAGPDLAKLQEEVIPQKGFVFNFKWGDMGKKLIDDGVIDETKLAKALTGTENMPPEFKKYLDGSVQQIELNSSNSQFWVDVLWGLGLANKNELLEKGPMVEEGRIANFASTGGFTIGPKNPMNVYSKFSYIKLTPDQQARVVKVAGGIYRPCCGNSTAFPDCNHGMAALALVELMVSQNFSDEEIYKTVLRFNSFWFPQTYLDVSYHFAKNNRDFKAVPASEILSKTFSSSQGYQAIASKIGVVDWPILKNRGGSCGA